MGIYLNPGNSGFARIVNSDYVDKTQLIGLLNDTIGTTRNLTCVSRPRRFGKSYAAQMLCAYYDKTCDSRGMFDDYEISGSDTYEEHLNRYDVIYLDMTGIIGETRADDIISYIRRNIVEEIRSQYPEVRIEEGFAATLVNLTEYTGDMIVMIIDEWDAPIREFGDDQQIQREYLEFLRSLFKNSGMTSRIFAAAYITGILPVKKDGTQSAISDFREFTMIKPRIFAEYVGFTESEVRRMCTDNELSFEQMKQWYNGYRFKGTESIYNPNSVMQAIENRDFDSYWTESSAAESLMQYISMDYTGLTKTIAELIGGVHVKVSTTGFANDLKTFRNGDDVLTLLIHLGYLAYDSETGTAYIPNEEIRQEFIKNIREVDHRETLVRLQESDQLFTDTINRNTEAVASAIEKIHSEETSPLHYNREDSLRSVIKLAYYTYRDHYIQLEELPAGVGYSDIVYLPKHDSSWPALVVELKWNKSAQGAIDQILRRKYPDVLKGYGAEILLVGINYDKDAPPGERRHTCEIMAVDPFGEKKGGGRSGGDNSGRPGKRRNRDELAGQITDLMEENGDMSMNEIAHALGYVRLNNTVREVIHTMIESGRLKYLYPDNPRNSRQKICLCER